MTTVPRRSGIAARLPLAVAAMTVALGARASLATGDLIQVAEYAWTNLIAQGQYTEVYGETAPLRPLYLWTRLRGERDALETLRREGKLPIRHQWFKAVGSRRTFEGTTTPTDAIALAVGSSEQLVPLDTELRGRGFFDWRTWSRKDHLRPGVWVVRLVYADNSAVKCNGSDSKCEFAIDVQ